MKYKIAVLSSMFLMVSSFSAAKNEGVYFDFQKHVQEAIKDGSIDGKVKFYLEGEPNSSGRIIKKDVVTNKKSSAATLRTDEKRCAYVLKSALIQLDKRAKQEGASKVINLKSWYKKQTYRDPKKYECHVGTWAVGVTLKGDLAK